MNWMISSQQSSVSTPDPIASGSTLHDTAPREPNDNDTTWFISDSTGGGKCHYTIHYSHYVSSYYVLSTYNNVCALYNIILVCFAGNGSANFPVSSRVFVEPVSNGISPDESQLQPEQSTVNASSFSSVQRVFSDAMNSIPHDAFDFSNPAHKLLSEAFYMLHQSSQVNVL